jgi:O-antigen/teichoic acid export membrane protein
MSNNFLTKTAHLFGGNILGQLIVVLSAPILTRIYSPEDFGLLGSFMAVIAVFGVLSTLRYESAIVLETSVIGATTVIALCMVLIVFSATVASAFFYLLYWAKLLPAEMLLLDEFIWLLPFGLLSMSLYKVVTWIAVKAQQLEAIGVARLQQNTVMVTMQTILGGIGFGPAGLILGQLVGVSSGIIRLSSNLKFRRIYRLTRFQKSYIKYMSLKYKRFFKYSLPGDIFNVLAQQLPVILLASLFSPAIAGFYVLADKVFRSPLAMISDGVGKSIMSVAVVSKERGTLGVFALLFFKPLVRLSSAGFMLFAAVAPSVFGFMFGLNWVEAGVYAQLMTPLFFTIFIFVPVLTLLVILERQKHEILFQASLFTVVLSGLVIGYFTSDARATIMVLSVGGALVYSVFGIWTLILAGVTTRQLMSFFLNEIGIILVLGGILYAAYPDLSGLNYNSPVVWLFLVAYIMYTVFLLQNLRKQLQALGRFSNDLLIG